jgi:SAM-dependent methyltransferase
MDLSVRVVEGELMDSPDLAPEAHQRALLALDRVNWLSRTSAILAEGILEQLQRTGQTPSGQPLRVLDLACGGGLVTLDLAQRLRAAGLNCEVCGWDRSPVAIDFARQLAARHPSGPHVQFESRDALSITRAEAVDVVTCTLFLHHLQDDDARELLGRMYSAAGRLVIIDDLRRTWMGLWLARLGCQLLTRSPVVHADGPQSVRAAFTETELDGLGRQAGLPPAKYQRHWPQRFLMWWLRR